MASNPLPAPTQLPRNEGVTVVGEAVRRIAPDSAEFLIEISATATTAAQALRDNHMKAAQVSQAVTALGVHQADLQTISLNVHNLYSPAAALPSFGGMPQIGQGGFPAFPGLAGPPELHFGSYHAKNTLRVNVREPGRLGEIVDAAARAGATIVGGFSLKPSDEANARRTALEAAGKDARSKAEALANAAGRQVGEPIAISEDIVTSNGAYAALRAALPFAFSAGTPNTTGDLEYYARVSASFRFQ